jgi:hypothetical protein
MAVERYTYERACQIEAAYAARGMKPIQGQQRRLDVLAAAGLPRVRGPRPVRRSAITGAFAGLVEINVYTWAEAADIIRHPQLPDHVRERLCKYGADRRESKTIEERRAYWRSVLVALALGAPWEAL